MSDNIFQRMAKAIRYTITGAEGWMGPGNPLPPAHQELPTRRFDYQVAQNTAFSPAAIRRGRKDELTYNQLRNLADNYDLLRAVIEYRKGQIAGSKWQVLSKNKDPDAPPTKEEQFAMDLLNRPTPTDTWETWVKKLMEDLLVVDSVALYPIDSGGELEELRLVDGGTIKKMLSDTGELPAVPEVAYQQIIKGIPMRDFTTDDLLVRHMNPRTHMMYGFSPVEMVVMTALIAMRRQSYQLGFYTEGTIPDALATVPESWSPKDIREFQEWFDGALEGSNDRRKLRFLPIDASKVKVLEKKDLVDKTDEWFARVICFAFGVDPMFLVSMMNRATSEQQHDAAHEASIMPIFAWIASLINEVFKKYDVNVTFSWSENSKIPPDLQAGIDQKDVQLGILSIPEVRKKRGYPSKGYENIPPMVYTTAGPIPITAFAHGGDDPGGILPSSKQQNQQQEPEESQQGGQQPPNSKKPGGKQPPNKNTKVVPMRGAGQRKALGYDRPNNRSYVDKIESELGIVDSEDQSGDES